MKKFGLFVMVIGYLAVLSCSSDKDEPDLMEVREVAWNSIGEGEYGRQSVITPWQEAEVSTREGTFKVTFHTEQDPLLGPIVVYVDMETLEVTGYAPRY